MIAEVYVELTKPSIDRPFDYIVPKALENVIMVGMRIIVPFGARKLLGFVVKLKTTSTFANLKKIDSLLDLNPILDNELLKLGQYIAKETICPTVVAYQAMLPVALKGKYTKTVELCANKTITTLPFTVQSLFQDKRKINWEKVVEADCLPEIKKAVSQGVLEIVYHINDRKKVKIKKIVRLLLSHADLKNFIQTVPERATVQKKIITYFLENEIRQIDLNSLKMELELTSNIAINQLVKKGIFLIENSEYYRSHNESATYEKTLPLQLTEQQKAVIKPINKAVSEENNKTFLLFGITGSGKTEVYLQAIALVLEKKKQAIVLVPEIALTPQIVARFKSRFGRNVAVLHSGLSSGERYDEWRKIYRKEVAVVVGARSAIFAPFSHIGLIIIDEEHEAAYKQEETPRYHVRDIAKKRAVYHNCPLILGSATPSLESFARAKKDVYHLLLLNERANQKQLPQVDIIDMRQELRAGNRSIFSRQLQEKITIHLKQKQQIVLLLNRRGYAIFVLCRECGNVIKCPNCDVSLTYHRYKDKMKCHYCNYEIKKVDQCPKCQSKHIRFFGTGTQKVEEEIYKYFPTARVLRMDVDTTRKIGAHEKILHDFATGKADILLGTQMIAKGLDFPNITLVGVIAADSSLHMADFRAAEKTFQLLTQVSGRCGRHKLPGEVIVQAYTPDHYSILLAAKHDYEHFFYQEMAIRKKTLFPPYTFLTMITVSHPEQLIALEVTHMIVQYLKSKLTQTSTCFGPTPAPLHKINNRFRYQCYIRYRFEPSLSEVLTTLYYQMLPKKLQMGVHVIIDMNPNISL